MKIYSRTHGQQNGGWLFGKPLGMKRVFLRSCFHGQETWGPLQGFLSSQQIRHVTLCNGSVQKVIRIINRVIA